MKDLVKTHLRYTAFINKWKHCFNFIHFIVMELIDEWGFSIHLFAKQQIDTFFIVVFRSDTWGQQWADEEGKPPWHLWAGLTLVIEMPASSV